MARKRGSRKRKFNLRRVRVSTALAPATLASKTVLSVGVTAAADGEYRIISCKGSWTVSILDALDGPLVVGFAFDDYSDTEIEEAIEALTAISLGDKIAQERANRLVRIVGTLSTGNEALNDGKPISTKLNWKIPVGSFVRLFIYNDGPTMQTGSTVSFNGDLWLKDD